MHEKKAKKLKGIAPVKKLADVFVMSENFLRPTLQGLKSLVFNYAKALF